MTTVPLKLRKQYTTNPETNRPIKIGGRIWLKLVNEGVINNSLDKIEYKDPCELAVIEEGDEEAIEQKKNELNETLPIDEQAVRGRGKHKGKIVKRKVRPSTIDVVEHTTEIAKKVVNENLDHLNECDDLDAELERLILAELSQSGTKDQTKSKKVAGTKLIRKGKCVKYTTEPESSESESENESESSLSE